MALGLSGLARNLVDGTVEVLVEGDSEAVHELGVLLKKGPGLARVETVERSDLPHELELPNPFETE
jgi:acylphosphatase